MVLSLPLLSCELSVSLKENPGRKKKLRETVIPQVSSPKKDQSHEKKYRASSSSQSCSPPRRRKERSKKQSKKRWRRKPPSLSSSSPFSHSLSSESEKEDQETKRILPPELAFYANTQFEKYIPGKSLHDAICEVHPVPINLNQVIF